jgi:prepilin-type N-terminal cleavage/methylation domain-containing protein
MKKGFTLIELLVVIAIIGLLSSIVLASLSSARDKAKEAKILSSLKSINNQAEIFRIDNNNYVGLCDDPKISEMVTSISTASDGAKCWVSTDDYSGVYQEELAEIDYGVGVTANGIYYGAEPTGTFTFDTTNTDNIQNWTTAIGACPSGKRLPGPSVLRAIYDIGGAAPLTANGFTASYYWSYLESPSAPSLAYVTRLYNGYLYRFGNSYAIYVRCVH